MSKIKGYRTIAFNIIMALAAVLTFGGSEVSIDSTFVSENLEAIENGVIAAWALGNLILRAITTTPIFRKE